MNQSACDYLAELETLGAVGQWACQRIIGLTVENLGLKKQLEGAQAANRQLERRLEQLERQAHRQAAPFRRDESERSCQP